MSDNTPFVAASITFAYDAYEDRLKLFFTNQQQQQVLCLFTRRMLSNLLRMLPKWIDKQTVDNLSHTASLKCEMTVFKFEAAQQAVSASYDTVSINNALQAELIETVHFSYLKHESGDRVRLTFVEQSRTQNIVMILTLDELYKLLGEILNKVPDWALPNPWHSSHIGVKH